MVSLTCDGAAANITMLKGLGCNFSTGTLKTCFPHPQTGDPVAAFLDLCHMVKLVRNAFCMMKTFVDNEGNTILWHYIEMLHNMQEKKGLHLANKLRAAHIRWQKQPMKVGLAAQIPSCSAADALAECRSIFSEGFAGSKPTKKFIRIMKTAFDIKLAEHVPKTVEEGTLPTEHK